ncbi:glycerophosphodiester phosphodiesterase family protein [Tritonibacter horizontis]|uniref:Glycerophosphoryl diester phosphodiesterase n=1 Tax=Tritonibacter horizontis TaxID=1768241 RepID=A0A132BU14_9RHOB|nr:glycerophosphodiester phosphodiesterase family protein [Tritonibacter horizontis]KUP91552.1 glycerophosphoryl diester phosphodiesterase [Tritonibacter horizontis]
MARPDLPQAFVTTPISHRALHGQKANCPENSRAAIRAAMDAGYGIEIDLQLAADGRAMVFHDDVLDRLTAQTGPVRNRSAAELGAIALRNGDGEGIPTFAEVLETVAGRVPLLVEIKDQDGAMGADVGALERAAIADLAGYDGPVALMSFNPHSVAELARLAPDLPRGLTTSAYDPAVWTALDAPLCDRLREIADFDRVGASFISHEAGDVARPRVQALRQAGVPILSWTIRSPAQEAEVRRHADNITFEGYLSPLPG